VCNLASVYGTHVVVDMKLAGLFGAMIHHMKLAFFLGAMPGMCLLFVSHA
jgi:hypothetical protein